MSQDGRFFPLIFIPKKPWFCFLVKNLLMFFYGSLNYISISVCCFSFWLRIFKSYLRIQLRNYKSAFCEIYDNRFD